MVNEDWLSLPGDEPAAPFAVREAAEFALASDGEKNPDALGYELPGVRLEAERRQAVVAAVNEIKAHLPVLAPRISTTQTLPTDPAARTALLDKSWRKLTPQQQTFLTALREHSFNVRATVRFLSFTADKVSRTNVNRWSTENEDFAFVLNVMKSIAATGALDRERLVLRAEEIAEEALEPTPILYQGAPTGFYENHKEVSLRATELQMKAAGMLKGEDKSTRVVVRFVNLAGPEDEPKPVIDVAAEVTDGE